LLDVDPAERRMNACRQPTPFVSTLHGRLDLPEHQMMD